MSSLNFNPKLIKGALIEKGSNSNGSWEKYVDGKMICYNRKSKTTTLNTAYGVFFISPLQTLDSFPQEFVDVPIVNLNFESTSNTFSLSADLTNKTKVGSVYLIGNFSLPSINYTYNYVAIGRWK